MDQSTYSNFELIVRNTDLDGSPKKARTGSQWFCNLFPTNAKIYGSPFLENRTTSIEGFSDSAPVAPNVDFMASILGGNYMEREVIYWPGEAQFYYYDTQDQIYHPCPEAKLGDLMRGYFARCAFDLQKDVNVYDLFTTFRTDHIINCIVERAKSILLASDSFFSGTSPHSRVSGIEQHQRLARVFVERLLVQRPDGVILVSAAYDRFASIVRERDLVPIKRSVFKDLVSPIIRERFGSGLRGDLVVDGRYQRGWKDLALNDGVGLN
jgi:hypothetical protein